MAKILNAQLEYVKGNTPLHARQRLFNKIEFEQNIEFLYLKLYKTLCKEDCHH